MEILELSPEEIKKAIDTGRLVGEGVYGSVFTYNDKLIKFDRELYKSLKDNRINCCQEIIEWYYKYKAKDFNNREQLEELLKRQPFIRPRVPLGIITLKDVDYQIEGISPGIILHPFLGYSNLSNVSKTDYKRLLMIFRKTLDDIKQLADNRICQEDLVHTEMQDDNVMYGFNFIQTSNDSQLIDLSGPLVRVGKNFYGADAMYVQFAELMNLFFEANSLGKMYDNESNIGEDDLERMINEFEGYAKTKTLI